MSRRTLLGTGALVLVLLAGWMSWPRQPGDTAARSDRPIEIVRDMRPGDGGGGGRQATTPVAAARPLPVAADGSAPVRDGAGRIPDDADVQASLPDPAFDPRALYTRVRSEARDREWAERSERNVQAALAAVPYVAHGDGLRVSCAATLCEVHGAMASGASPENTNVAMQALQGDALRTTIAAGGLDILTTSFGGTGGVATYTFYAKRR